MIKWFKNLFHCHSMAPTETRYVRSVYGEGFYLILQRCTGCKWTDRFWHSSSELDPRKQPGAEDE